MTTAPQSIIRHAAMLEIMPKWRPDEENSFIS